MEKKLKIAGLQLGASRDFEKNLSKASQLIEVAAGEGARIIALSQLFSLPWFPAVIDRSLLSLAEREDGRTISLIRELALKHNVVIIAPFFEEDKGDHFNSAAVIGDRGEILGKYRKVHVPQIPLWEERAYFKPGDTGFPVFKTPYCTIGVQLCWDVFFPEGWRILALKGAELVFAPTASAFEHSRRKWERAIGAAAHANNLFIFRVNRVGKEEKQEFYGGSFCVGPDGEYVEKPGGAGEGVVIASIDPADVKTMRNEWVFLKDRRPEEYGEIVKG